MRLRFVTPLLSLALLAGCSTNEPGSGGSLTISGSVTDEAASSFASSSSIAPVSGAVVTASRVSASGSFSALSGSATTDASGNFQLDTEATTDVVVVAATRESFAARALIEAQASSETQVTAPRMTSETTAETDVYVAARGRSQVAGVADAVLFVTAEVAADLRAAATTTADVAAAINASLDAEARASGASSSVIADVRAARRETVAALRREQAQASGASGRAQAFARFESDYADAFVSANVSSDQQARASQARTKALVRFSNGVSASARVSMRRRARVLAAFATGRAVEATFRARGASDARLSALVQAQTALVDGLQGAVSEEAMAQVEAAYAARVRAELSAETGIGSAEIAAAAQASAVARATFNTAIAAAASGEAVGTAVTAYFAAVESGAQSAFGAEAMLAIETVTLISLY